MSTVKGFQFEKGQPYVMPCHFGAVTEGWDGSVAHYADNTALTVMYTTDPQVAGEYLPPGFSVSDPAIVSVSYVMCRGVNYLFGGGYNLVAVNISSRFKGQADDIEGNFALVLWENQFIPIMLGREVLGAPKLFADIPDAWVQDNRQGFFASENGSMILEGELSDLIELSPEDRQGISDQANSQPWMGWKYIPSCDFKEADISAPTLLPSRTEIKEAWMGKGKVKFHPVPVERAPASGRILSLLNDLPVLEDLGGLLIRGSQDLLISEQRVLK